ncbi:MAG: ATP-binding protein [Patescibacteria group bacterium]
MQATTNTQIAPKNRSEEAVDPLELAAVVLSAFRLVIAGVTVALLINHSNWFVFTALLFYVCIAGLNWAALRRFLLVGIGQRFFVITDVLMISLVLLLYDKTSTDLAFFYAVPLVAAVGLLSFKDNYLLCGFTVACYLAVAGINVYKYGHITWGPILTAFTRSILFGIVWIPVSYIVERDRLVRGRRAAFLALFAEMSQKASELEVLKTLVQHSHQLGFERMRIWLLPTSPEQGVLFRSFLCTNNHDCAAEFNAGNERVFENDATGYLCLEKNQVLRCRYYPRWFDRMRFPGEWVNVLPELDPARAKLGKSESTEWLEMPLRRGSVSLGKVSLDNAITNRGTLTSDVANFTQLAEFLAVVFQRLQSHEEAQRKDAQHERVLDTLPIAVFFKDVDGRFQFVNRTCERYIGRAKDYINGKTDLELFPSDLAKKYWDNDRNVITEQSIFTDRDETFQMPNGSRVSISVVKVPLFTSVAGRSIVNGVLGYFTPSNDARVVEAESAERQFKMFRWFTHDSNELIKSIRSTLPLIPFEMRSKPINTQRVNNYIDEIARNVELTLCGYHAYGYWGAKKRYSWETSQQPMLISELVGRIVEVCLTNNDRVVLVAQVEPQNLSVCVDDFKFTFMVMQLVTNAIKAVDKRSSTGERKVVVSIYTQGDVLVTLVKDNGCGCPPEEQKKVGEEEFSTWNGSGLGLQIVRAFANMTGGSFSKKFPPEGGAEFCVKIRIV